MTDLTRNGYPRRRSQPHEDLMEWIRDAAKSAGLRHLFHDADSRRSWGEGFPDLCIAGPGGVIFAEVKVPPDELSANQRSWKWMLLSSGAIWVLWTPAEQRSGLIARQLAAIAGLKVPA